MIKCASLVFIILLVWLLLRLRRVKKGRRNYNWLIRNNTLFYYLLIVTSLLLSKLTFGHVSIMGVILWYVILFIIHEVQWYRFYTQLLKDELESVYHSSRSVITAKRDYTEDYRYIFVRNTASLGQFRWRFNTLKKIGFLVKAMFTDPYWIHKIVFGWTGTWLWQFGGDSNKPMPENKKTPIRAYIYVVQIQ